MSKAVRDTRRSPSAPPPRRPSARDDKGRPQRGEPQASLTITAWAIVGSITMLFFGLVSAYSGRRGGMDWGAVAAPPALWVGTAAILGSSVSLEAARRALARGAQRSFVAQLLGVAALGIAFLAAQISAWRALADAGVFLASSPHSSYLYLFTGVHGAHLAGGLIALGVVLSQGRQGAYDARHRGGVDAFAIYWHFLGVLWLTLFAVLFAF